MKQHMITALVGLSLSFAGMAACEEAAPHYSANQDRAAMVKYVESGTYEKELATAYTEAKTFLDSKIKDAKPNEKLAIVMDVDDTVLSNWNDMKRLDFTRNKEALVVAYAQGKDPAIKPALDFFNYAKAKKVAIFFVSGRADSEEIRKFTTDNLHNQGFDGWTEMFLRPLNDENKSASTFKTATRKKLNDDGYSVILNIGDQESDLIGGHAQKIIKLPNPFYKLA